MTTRCLSKPFPSVVARALVSLLALLLSACTVGPDYTPPQEIDDDPRWSDDWADPTDTTPAVERFERWWSRLGDPTLERLVDDALANNPSLHEATARVAEARAVRDRVAGRELPTVAAGASVTERRQSANGALPIDRIPGLDRDQTLFDLGFDASWELDLFGRTDRALEAATARLQSAAAERRAAHLAVAAEVARVYGALREGQRRLAALVDQVASARHTAELVALRVEAGEDPRLELARVEGDLRGLEARLPALRAALRARALALGVLTGAAPEAGLPLLDDEPTTLDLAPFPLGARADLLRRRPDVRAAERRLAAASADIGLATAELYPRLSVGARGGFQALDGADLLEGDSVTWSLVPAISWRLFDGGRVRAEIHLAEARAAAAAHAWEATVLEALADAERALVRYRGGLEALELEQAAVDATRRTRDLEALRYEAGDIPLQAVLVAEGRYDQARSSLADTRERTLVEMVALYKALGGGWDDRGSRAERDESMMHSAQPTL